MELRARTSARCATAMLVNQPINQGGLPKERGKDRQNLHTIFFPCGWLAKVDFASRRQVALADTPALHFPPIELRRCKLDGRGLDVARFLAAENASGNSRSLSASLEHREKRPSNKLTTEKRIVIRKNGRVRHSMKPWQARIAFVHDSRRIDNHQFPENGGLRWKSSSMIQYALER